tara:strand:- start:1236 stop:1637 length:402 start_codon:yes stop_codon:yes gene_type:complete
MDNDKKYVHAISGRIAQLRAKNKLTLRALASLLDVSANTVKKWCDGDAVPSRKNLAAVAKVFDVSPAFLMFGTGKGSRRTGNDPLTKMGIDLFQVLSTDNQRTLISLMSSLLESTRNETEITKQGSENGQEGS